MILYNITIIIEDEINEKWLSWANEYFLPEFMATNLIASNRFLKVIDSPNEGTTYCMQFIFDDIGTFHSFKERHYNRLMDQHESRFNNKSVFFSTLMEFIDNSWIL